MSVKNLREKFFSICFAIITITALDISLPLPAFADGPTATPAPASPTPVTNPVNMNTQATTATTAANSAATNSVSLTNAPATTANASPSSTKTASQTTTATPTSSATQSPNASASPTPSASATASASPKQSVPIASPTLSPIAANATPVAATNKTATPSPSASSSPVAASSAAQLNDTTAKSKINYLPDPYILINGITFRFLSDCAGFANCTQSNTPIQAAVNYFAQNSSKIAAYDRTIFVDGGTYSENVSVTGLDSFALRGGANGNASVINGSVTIANSVGITLQQFTVRQGVSVTSSSNIALNNIAATNSGANPALNIKNSQGVAASNLTANTVSIENSRNVSLGASDAGGNLEIKMNGVENLTVNGGAGNDTITLKGKDVTGSVKVFGGAGDDLLVVDNSLGKVIPLGGIFYDGGSGFDNLSILGGVFQSETYTPGPGAWEGLLTFDGAPIHFTRVEPVCNTTASSSLIYNGNDVGGNANDTITIRNYNAGTDGACAGAVTTVTGAIGVESISFANLGNVTINGNGGDDTFTINASTIGASTLTITGGTGNNTINGPTGTALTANWNITAQNQGTLTTSTGMTVNFYSIQNIAGYASNTNIFVFTGATGVGVDGTIDSSGTQSFTYTNPPTYQIYYASDRTGDWEIYRMNLDGTTRIRLTFNNATDIDPTVSPDGTRVAFVSLRDGDREIYAMDAVDGKNFANLTNSHGSDDMQPSWSPVSGSNLIAFKSERSGGGDIYILDAVSKTITLRLTNDSALDEKPSWSPDGSKIAFGSTRDGTFHIHKANSNATESGVVRITSSGQNFDAAWSPDNSKVAIASNRTGNNEIFLVSPTPFSETQLTFHGAVDAAPAWSLDSTVVYWHTIREGNTQIYKRNANGSGSDTRVTASNTGSNDQDPVVGKFTAPAISSGGNSGNNGGGDGSKNPGDNKDSEPKQCQEVHTCPISKPDLPKIHLDTIAYVEWENRRDYSILVPSTTAQGIWRQLFLFNDLDNKQWRVQRYKDVFFEAMIRPALSTRLKEGGDSKLFIISHLYALLSKVEKNSEAYDTFYNMLSVLLDPHQGIFELQPHAVQTTLLNWDKVSEYSEFSNVASRYSTAFAGLSLGTKMAADALEDFMLHLLVDTEVSERMDFLWDFVKSGFINDPAAEEGFFLAREEIQQILNQKPDILVSSLNSLRNNSVDNLIQAAPLAVAVLESAQKISPANASLFGRVALPWSLAYTLGSELQADITDIQNMSVAATLDYNLGEYEKLLELRLHSPSSAIRIPEIERKIIVNQDLRYGLGYYFNSKYDDILSVKPEKMSDWIQLLVQGVTAKWDSIGRFRSEVLQTKMNDNYKYAVEILPYLDLKNVGNNSTPQ